MVLIFAAIACGQDDNANKTNGTTFEYTIQMAIDKLIYKWAGANQSDSLFQKVYKEVLAAKKQSKTPFIDLFSDAYTSDSSISLVAIFNTNNNIPELTSASSNSEVIVVLKSRIDIEIKKLIGVLGKRLSEYGLQDIKIKKGKGDRINVYGANAKDPKRLVKILSMPAIVGYWPTYDFFEDSIYSALIQADDTLGNYYNEFAEDSMEQSQRLFNYLVPNFKMNENGSYFPGEGPLLGYVKIEDTARVNAMFKFPFVKKLFPKDVIFMWGAKPPSYSKNSKGEQLMVLELFTIRDQNKNGLAPISNEQIADLALYYNDIDKPEILISMTESGAQKWKKMTGYNLRKSIAIVIDNRVFSAPTVQAQIEGGRSTISGDFDKEELSDFVVMINGGVLNIPVTVVKK